MQLVLPLESLNHFACAYLVLHSYYHRDHFVRYLLFLHLWFLHRRGAILRFLPAFCGGVFCLHLHPFVSEVLQVDFCLIPDPSFGGVYFLACLGSIPEYHMDNVGY